MKFPDSLFVAEYCRCIFSFPFSRDFAICGVCIVHDN